MKKGLKVLLVIVFIIVFTVGIIYGMKIYGEYTTGKNVDEEAYLKLTKYEESVEGASGDYNSTYKVYSKDTVLGSYENGDNDIINEDEITANPDSYWHYADYKKVKLANPSYYIPLIQEIDAKYIWLEDEKIYGTSRYSLENKIEKRIKEGVEEFNGKPVRDQIDNNISSLSQIEKAVEFAIGNLTNDVYGNQENNWGFSAGNETNMDFLEGLFPKKKITQGYYFMNKTNPIRQKGLYLKVDNIDIEKYIYSNNRIQFFNSLYQVKCDVKTISKTKRFDKYDWIPEENETNTVTLMICGGVLNNNLYIENATVLDIEKNNPKEES